MIGRTLGHYRIDSQLGQGGMGVVYRARDLRLERDVALKVLPAGLLADESARKRFRKEALALSQLNHPNIATVHDFDTADGVDFLVLEYIAGVSLSEKLASGALMEKELAGLATQLALGLAAAHEQGIVHRDLKPGNLRVTPDGRLKILDFGLATLVRPSNNDAASTVGLTEGPAVAGTLPYMAPEQLRGESADPRSDLHAAGAVLYEMSTGRRAFPQVGGPQIIAAILQEKPAPPASISARVSPAMEAIVLKCLDKDRERRYQSAREMRVDLERLTSPTTAAVPVSLLRRRRWLLPAGVALAVLALAAAWAVFRTGQQRIESSRIESLAVLPLDNLSGDSAQEYFSDGMTEALITDLGKVASLRVISRSAVVKYKGPRQSLAQIARELKVDALVEGAVMRSGERVRITARLIHPATDRQLWSESYERDLRDVLALQGEVARAVASQIRAQVRLSSTRPVDPQAYELFLR
ncbi:MAG: protein kinase domain-containing protein, partial [Bryobacteraceae bacterium]